jgi:hypothetical protein
MSSGGADGRSNNISRRAPPPPLRRATTAPAENFFIGARANVNPAPLLVTTTWVDRDRLRCDLSARKNGLANNDRSFS